MLMVIILGLSVFFFSTLESIEQHFHLGKRAIKFSKLLVWILLWFFLLLWPCLNLFLSLCLLCWCVLLNLSKFNRSSSNSSCLDVPDLCQSSFSYTWLRSLLLLNNKILFWFLCWFWLLAKRSVDVKPDFFCFRKNLFVKCFKPNLLKIFFELFKFEIRAEYDFFLDKVKMDQSVF